MVKGGGLAPCVLPLLATLSQSTIVNVCACACVILTHFLPACPLVWLQYGSVAYPKHHTQADISDIYLFSYVSPADAC